MVDINHSNITDPYLHEPKGVASAPMGSVYFSDGTGSGSWKTHHQVVAAYIPFNSATPYQHACTTTDTPLNPTFSVEYNEGFTPVSSPNARIVYTGSQDVSSQISLTLSTRNSTSQDRAVTWTVYKNGVALGGKTIRTISPATWGSITVTGYTVLSTNDYIEIKSSADDICTIDYASGYLTIVGLPEL